MKISLLVSAKGLDADGTRSIIDEVGSKLEGVQSRLPESVNSGLAMDPSIAIAVLDVLKVTLSALITTLGTIWAAKIATEGRKSNRQENLTIIIETESEDITLRLSNDGSISRADITQIPTSPEKVTRLRLSRGVKE